jgi:plasmid maintenance system antidote protein VapI
MRQTQYLDAAKRKLGIESDYALAPFLGVTKQAISKLRNGRAVMSNTMAAKIAEILDIDLVRVIADLELERGSNEELWRRIARQVAGVLVPAVMAIGAASFPAPAQAGFNINSLPLAPASSPAALSEYALHRTRRRRRWWSVLWP